MTILSINKDILIQGSNTVENCMGTKMPWWVGGEGEKDPREKMGSGKGGDKSGKQGEREEEMRMAD